MPLPSPASIFAAFAFVLPTLAIMSSQAVVPWLLLVALTAAVCAWRGRGWRPRIDRPLAVLMGTVVLWQAVASLWSFETGGSLVLALRLAALGIAALALWQLADELAPTERMHVQRWLLRGFALGALVMAVELAFDQPLYRLYMLSDLDDGASLRLSKLNRGATTLAILMWPATAVAWRRFGRWGLLLPVAVIALLTLTESHAALFGAGAGTAAALLALAHRRAGSAALAVALAVGVVAMPLVAKGLATAGLDELDVMPKNGRARVHIWDFAAERIAERPVFGWGFDAARDMPDFGRQPYSEELGDTIPLHPHNAALQVWLELGAVGVALVLALLVLTLRRSDRLPPVDRALAQATFASTLTIALIGYGIWQNQWLCIIFAAAAVALLARGAPASDMDSGRAGV